MILILLQYFPTYFPTTEQQLKNWQIGRVVVEKIDLQMKVKAPVGVVNRPSLVIFDFEAYVLHQDQDRLPLHHDACLTNNPQRCQKKKRQIHKIY